MIPPSNSAGRFIQPVRTILIQSSFSVNKSIISLSKAGFTPLRPFVSKLIKLSFPFCAATGSLFLLPDVLLPQEGFS